MQEKTHERGSANKQTAKAAHTSIQTHLDATSAATKALRRCRAEDFGKLHKARVTARRALTCLDMYGNFLDETFIEDTRQNLKKIRKDCGNIRDRQIFLKILADLGPVLTYPELNAGYTIIKKLRKHIDRHSDKLRARLEKDSHKKFLRRVKAHLAAPERLNIQSGPIVEFAPLAIAKELRELHRLHAAADDQNSLTAIHDLRRQFKTLRYTLDDLHQHMGTQTPRQLYAVLTDAQNILGVLADYDTCLDILRSCKPDSDRDGLGFALITARLDMLIEKQHAVFVDFWQERVKEDFGFELLKAWGLRDSTARWLLGKAKVITLPKPTTPARMPRKAIAAMGAR